jgi:hypothetical protein
LQGVDPEIANQTTDPATLPREFAEALQHTETLGQVIEAQLDDAERELAEIRRAALPSRAGR